VIRDGNRVRLVLAKSVVRILFGFDRPNNFGLFGCVRDNFRFRFGSIIPISSCDGRLIISIIVYERLTFCSVLRSFVDRSSYMLCIVLVGLTAAMMSVLVVVAALGEMAFPVVVGNVSSLSAY